MLALGIGGEAGEIIDHIKKNLYHGHPLDVVKLRAELGDLLWYIAVLGAELDMNLAYIAQGNVDKLAARYTGQRFNEEDSINRVD